MYVKRKKSAKSIHRQRCRRNSTLTKWKGYAGAGGDTHTNNNTCTQRTRTHDLPLVCVSFQRLQTCYCVCNLESLIVNLPGALRRYRDGPSSKSLAITGKRPVVSVHYEHPQRESRAQS